MTLFGSLCIAESAEPFSVAGQDLNLQPPGYLTCQTRLSPTAVARLPLSKPRQRR